MYYHLRKESVGRRRGGLAGAERGGGRAGCEDALGEVARQVPGLQHRQLVGRVVRVDEGRLGDCVIIILVLVLFRLPDLILGVGLGGGLAAAGNVISL